jgi:phage terminase large subunit
MTTLNVPTPRAFGYLYDPPLGGLRYRVAYGGRGSAKSWQFARALLVHGLSQPLRILCAREYQASIRDSVHRVLADQIGLLGLSDFYDIKESEIIGANGTAFLFKGLRRDIAQIKSTEGIDVCWVEEAEAVSDASWRTLIPTVRKPGSEIWVSFNPALADDPTYVRFVAKPPERAVVRKVSYADNPWFPDVLREEAESLRRNDPEAYAHVWGGEPWARTDAQVLAGKWTVEEFTPDATWGEPLFGADWGFASDPTVIVKVWVRDRMLWVEYADGQPQLDTDGIVRLFDGVPDARRYVIRGDSARPETIAELSKRGFRVTAAAKWPGNVEDGIQHLRSYDRIVIHPRCKRAIEEARLWRYKTDPRTEDVLPKLVDGNDHAWDSVRYALGPLIKKGPSVFVV